MKFVGFIIAACAVHYTSADEVNSSKIVEDLVAVSTELVENKDVFSDSNKVNILKELSAQCNDLVDEMLTEYSKVEMVQKSITPIFVLFKQIMGELPEMPNDSFSDSHYQIFQAFTKLIKALKGPEPPTKEAIDEILLAMSSGPLAEDASGDGAFEGEMMKQIDFLRSTIKSLDEAKNEEETREILNSLLENIVFVLKDVVNLIPDEARKEMENAFAEGDISKFPGMANIPDEMKEELNKVMADIAASFSEDLNEVEVAAAA